MKKNGQKLEERRQFVKECLYSPEIGSDKLIAKIKRLKKSKNVTNTAEILGDIFYLSIDTIFRDFIG